MEESYIDKLARKIWDYHNLHHTLQKADCILVLGSNDTRVADRGSELYLQAWAPILIFSGGSGVLTQNLFNKPEAEIFADIAIEKGVPKEKILIENLSTNTGENIQFTRQLLDRHNLDPHKIILVQKPYMERRAYATFKKNWPEKDIIVTSPNISYEDYPNEIIPKELLINIMVGDLQRIKEYPSKGFQIEQEIPHDVWQAYEELVALGYTKHLIKD